MGESPDPANLWTHEAHFLFSCQKPWNFLSDGAVDDVEPIKLGTVEVRTEKSPRQMSSCDHSSLVR
jgi:hypothetical protein